MRVRIEFGMPFKGQPVPPEWEWGEIGEFNSNFDYQAFAKRIWRRLPMDGPTRIAIKVGDCVVGIWSSYNDLCEHYGF
jgi:hypothetical protein